MNVLLVTTDQQRADTVGAYGSRLEATPNLDRLAATGVRFDACRTQNPYCQPSRATTRWVAGDANSAGRGCPTDP